MEGLAGRCSEGKGKGGMREKGKVGDRGVWEGRGGER